MDGKTLGTFTVLYRAEDACGNAAEASREVVVVDTSPPDVRLVGEEVVEIPRGDGVWEDPGAIAVDACEGEVEVVIGGTPVDPSTCATYALTYTARDGSGNEATVGRTVSAVERTPLSVSCRVARPILWFPHRRLVDVGLRVTVEGADAADVSLEVEVRSDEAAGKGRWSPDARVRGTTLELRAERRWARRRPRLPDRRARARGGWAYRRRRGRGRGADLALLRTGLPSAEADARGPQGGSRGGDVAARPAREPAPPA